MLYFESPCKLTVWSGVTCHHSAGAVSGRWPVSKPFCCCSRMTAPVELVTRYTTPDIIVEIGTTTATVE